MNCTGDAAVQVAAGRGGNACTIPAAASKVDVMAAKRAEHQRTIAAHHSSLAHNSTVPHSLALADNYIESPPNTDAASPSTSAAEAAGEPGSSKAAKRKQSAATASDGAVGSNSHALQNAWLPDIVGSGGTGRFRDESFFLSAERPDRHAEEGYAVAEQGRSALVANVLDLMSEDNAGLLAERKQKVWDNKKKRYITLQKVCTRLF